MSNLFEIAARRKYRFESAKGSITVEDLFDLPLTSRNGFDLDMVARAANNDVKSSTEESFVTVNRRNVDAENKLEIVKFIIAQKQQQAAIAAERAERTETKRKILDAISRKKDEALSNASIEELEAQLASL
jgi:hypothetical protein